MSFPGARLFIHGHAQNPLRAQMAFFNGLERLRAFHRGGNAHQAVEAARIERAIFILSAMKHDDFHSLTPFRQRPRDACHLEECGGKNDVNSERKAPEASGKIR
jgi:hypothetical protein